jgi:DNA-3-methyladenine glycosylase
MSRRFSRNFYRQDSRAVARALLGAHLHRRINGKTLVGKIVETEAYGVGDPACHAFRGATPRTKVLFEEAGYSYVYFTYGMYWCFNVVANDVGVGEAVLVRAVEPLEGIDIMRANRPTVKLDRDLTNGPGKLCMAFALDKKDNGLDLIEDPDLFITKGEKMKDSDISVSSRIGLTVATEYDWRYFVNGNPFVSPGKPSDVVQKAKANPGRDASKTRKKSG